VTAARRILVGAVVWAASACATAWLVETVLRRVGR
jgi:hypothetical protein